MGTIREKEARAELYVNGVRRGGSFTKIYDINVKPDAVLNKKRFTGQKRAEGDLDVIGQDCSFKTELSDHMWSDLWQEIQEAEENEQDLPDISIVFTYAYRGGITGTRTITLHGGPAMKMDEHSIPLNGYLVNTWSAFFSYATPT